MLVVLVHPQIRTVCMSWPEHTGGCGRGSFDHHRQGRRVRAGAGRGRQPRLDDVTELVDHQEVVIRWRA